MVFKSISSPVSVTEQTATDKAQSGAILLVKKGESTGIRSILLKQNAMGFFPKSFKLQDPSFKPSFYGANAFSKTAYMAEINGISQDYP